MIGFVACLAFTQSAPSAQRSRHVVLTTDRGALEAARLLRAGEAVLAETQAVLHTTVKTDLVGDIALATTTGEPSVKLEAGVLRISVQVGLDADSERILRQGIAERVLQTDVLGSQPWAVRGLALWLATASQAGIGALGDRQGVLHVGSAPADFVFYNSDVAPPNGPAWIDARELPTIAQLLAASSANFTDDKSGHLYAAAAWMLVSVLQDVRLGYGGVLGHLAAELRCGHDAGSAWAHAIGKKAGGLDKDYREQVVRHGVKPLAIVVPTLAAKAMTEPSQEAGDGGSPQTLTTQARTLLQAGDYAQAQALLEKAIAQQPGCARCLDNFAYALFAQHHAPEAENAEARAAVLAPQDKGIGERLAKYRGLLESLGQKPLNACKP